VQSGCALDDETFRALGFTLSATDTAANLRIYDYDLATYKTVPDWLNARYWANPNAGNPKESLNSRHCERSEAIQNVSEINDLWIATSLRSSR